MAMSGFLLSVVGLAFSSASGGVWWAEGAENFPALVKNPWMDLSDFP